MASMNLSKIGAVKIILAASSEGKRSGTRARELMRAASALHMTGDERVELFVALEYCDSEGRPYPYAGGKTGRAFWNE